MVSIAASIFVSTGPGPANLLVFRPSLSKLDTGALHAKVMRVLIYQVVGDTYYAILILILQLN